MRRYNVDRPWPRLTRGLAFVLVALSALPAFAQSQTITLPSSQDNTLYEESEGAISNGKGTHFFVGTTTSRNIRRGVIAFDTSIIPPNSTITAATLRLNMSRSRSGGGQPVTLHRLTTSWGEGDSMGFGEEGAGNVSMNGDATWVHRFWNTVAWARVGGDFAATPSATTSVSSTGFYSWTGAGVLADVQSWVTTPANNFGWLLKTTETADATAKRFDTKENANLSFRPALQITYTPPATAGACCMPSGACFVTTADLCASHAGTFQGVGTTCTPNPCAIPTGACCLPTGVCTVVTQAHAGRDVPGQWGVVLWHYVPHCAGALCGCAAEPGDHAADDRVGGRRRAL
jgi:hypothetical protein